MPQISSQENQVKKYEVKILRQIEYLPKVFMIKHLNGEVTKVSILQKWFVNCTKYVSEIDSKFHGCLKYENGKFMQTRGIYYTPVLEAVKIFNRNEFSKDLEKMKYIIIQTLKDYNLVNSRLLIEYNNFEINIYDYFVKGKLYQFPLIFNQDYLEIYEVPPISPKANVDPFYKKNLIFYEHEVQFSNEVKIFEGFSEPGEAVVINPENNITLTIKSSTNSESSVMLKANKFYLITHPRPRIK